MGAEQQSFSIFLPVEYIQSGLLIFCIGQPNLTNPIFDIDRPGPDSDQVHGKSAGGKADELRLLSTSKDFINLRAHGGSLDFVSTKVQ